MTSRGDTEVRELGHDDLGALLEAYRDLNPQDDPLPDPAEVERVWADICRDPRLACLGAWRRGELMATCIVDTVPNLTRGARPYALIENVWARPDARRRGFGSMVLRAALDRCWARGCYKVMLLSGSRLDGAHAFYERNGFDKHAKRAFVITRR